MWHPIKRDPCTGVTVYIYIEGDNIHIRHVMLVDDIIEANRQRYNAGLNQKWGDGKKIFSIPSNLYFEQLHEPTLNEDKKYLSKWLNDPDHRAFRTFPGKV